jgi:AraC family transcriptional regulator
MSMTAQVAREGNTPDPALSAAILRLLADARSAVVQDPHSADLYLEQATRLLRGAQSSALVPGGLAPWQMRMVREHILAHLAAPLSVRDLAAVARLSHRHFARAFKASFGMAPHAFVMRRRVERAKAMILDSGLPLSEVALACGFSDQSHLTRLFSRVAGVTPAAWRRCHAAG